LAVGGHELITDLRESAVGIVGSVGMSTGIGPTVLV
jgi:hypothetical protein